jgi:molybdopterin-synthase adenylyltransferase
MDDNMNKEIFSVLMTDEIDQILGTHLNRRDRQEELCFGLFNASIGSERYTGIVDEIMLPEEGDRNVHGNVSFNPQYYDRVLARAVKRSKGIVLIHCHPTAKYWQAMSDDDYVAESSMAGAVYSMTDQPLIGLTRSNVSGFWSGRCWVKTDKWKHVDCENIRVVGDSINVSFCPEVKPEPSLPESLIRTIDSWGERVQKDISRLRVGIVGLGSVGSFVAEGLARMGVSELTLIDFDTIEEINRDRTLNAYKYHVHNKTVKVSMTEEAVLKVLLPLKYEPTFRR